MATTQWIVDPSHSEIGFKVKHLMITNVAGIFRNYEIKVETEDLNFESAKISFSADIDSISTGNQDRDNHLKSMDFFNINEHLKLKFISTGMEKR